MFIFELHFLPTTGVLRVSCSVYDVVFGVFMLLKLTTEGRGEGKGNSFME
jgi:hypothetical protein